MIRSVAIALIAAASLSLVHAQTDLPTRFPSREVATKAGCRFARVKGPATDTCVLTGFRSNQMEVVVFEGSKAGAYTASTQMAITSWYQGAHLSLVDVLHARTDWLVIDTEGMRGTGVYQRILLIIGWDGTRFRTAAAESLGYECSRSTREPAYKLQVRHAFESTDGAPGLRLSYEMTKDRQPIGQWSDRLRWNAAVFAFVPFRTTPDAPNSVVDDIRKNIGRVREYSVTRRFDPTNTADTFMFYSGLLDVVRVCA